MKVKVKVKEIVESKKENLKTWLIGKKKEWKRKRIFKKVKEEKAVNKENVKVIEKWKKMAMKEKVKMILIEKAKIKGMKEEENLKVTAKRSKTEG